MGGSKELASGGGTAVWTAALQAVGSAGRGQRYVGLETTFVSLCSLSAC